MKIKATQLDQLDRDRISRACTKWADRNEVFYPGISRYYKDLAQRIKHGELILCEYQYQEQEKGGRG